MREPQAISMVFRERSAGEGGQEAIQRIPAAGINVSFSAVSVWRLQTCHKEQ